MTNSTQVAAPAPTPIADAALPHDVATALHALAEHGATITRLRDGRTVEVHLHDDAGHDTLFEVDVCDGCADPLVNCHWADAPLDRTAAEDHEVVVHVNWADPETAADTLLAWAGYQAA